MCVLSLKVGSLPEKIRRDLRAISERRQTRGLEPSCPRQIRVAAHQFAAALGMAAPDGRSKTSSKSLQRVGFGVRVGVLLTPFQKDAGQPPVLTHSHLQAKQIFFDAMNVAEL